MKLDMLQECNDQHIPPKDFMQTFCVRCRNTQCVNAGWAGSSFEYRMATQVDRLLIHPNKALPDDPKYSPIRALHFLEVAEAIVLQRREDPWAGPGVHLAEPPRKTATHPTVEEAVSKLAATKGRRPPTMVTVEEEAPMGPSPEPPPMQTVPAPVVPAPVVVPVQPVVAHPMVNTEFPEEGVMIGGGPPPVGGPAPVVDPWAPKPKPNIVPRGAKIKMTP